MCYFLNFYRYASLNYAKKGLSYGKSFSTFKKFWVVMKFKILQDILVLLIYVCIHNYTNI